MLAEDAGAAKGVTGKYWYGRKQRSPKKEANEDALQQNLVNQLEELTGITVPDT
jgi:hypothetical protein